MDTNLMPDKTGQICKIISTIPDDEPEAVFIVTEDPLDFDEEDEILIVNLKELQRNISKPENAERISIRKKQLVVISDDLSSYIQSWNTNNKTS